jgi:tRNA-dihydrouridine synthase C
MEGVGDRSFRKAMASVGGFDEAVRDFLRVPRCPHIKSLAREYEAVEIAPIPLAAQIMGAEPEFMGAIAVELAERGAPRIDVNCGCPSNTVTGKGAGSSLLKEPRALYEVARAVVRAVSIPVTIKMRSGYEDTSLFYENLAAAQESGVRYITLHPRTKADGYGPPARWDLIAAAKAFLKIPLVGNGDICTVEDAVAMLQTTRCDALMIGRGAIMNPFLFHQIRARFSGLAFQPKWEDLSRYFAVYGAELDPDSSLKQKVGKIKQLMSFFCKGNARLMERRQEILTSESQDPAGFLAELEPLLKVHWSGA